MANSCLSCDTLWATPEVPFPHDYMAMAETADATKAKVEDVIDKHLILQMKDELDEDASKEEPHASDTLHAGFDARAERTHATHIPTSTHVCD